MKPSGIGGQAVMEGVMMKNGEQYAVAVRKPNNEICVEVRKAVSISAKYPIFKLPILRGMAAFAESLSLGMSSLTFSSSFYEEEEEESEFEKKLNKVTKGKADSILNTVTIVLSVVLALGIFVALPMLLAGLLGKLIESKTLLAVLEGVFRVLIFVLYIVLISKIKDIERLFMYHGAEHKAINCIENGFALSVKNVRKQSREHKRCGTSFMLTVMVISVIFFMFVRVDNTLLRFAVRLLLIPVIAGVSYEFIRYAGRHDSALINVLSRPGMWLQALTTREPDKEMIEVAIRSIEAVFDWKEFLNGEKKKPERTKPTKKEKERELRRAAAEQYTVTMEPQEEEAPEKMTEASAEVPVSAEASVSSEEASVAVKTEAGPEKAEPLEIDIAQLFDIKLDTAAPAKQGKTKIKAMPKKDPIPGATKVVSEMQTKECDDVLAALDMYFEFNGPKSVMEISDEDNGEESE